MITIILYRVIYGLYEDYLLVLELRVTVIMPIYEIMGKVKNLHLQTVDPTL